MSAFDLTGAIISTPVAIFIWVMFWYGVIFETSAPRVIKTLGFCLLWGIVFAAWSAFCIVRLCGAHL